MTLTQILQKIKSVFYTKSEIDAGYLSKSGGAMTGTLTLNGKNVDTIEEQGVGYIRYSSGLQMCWGSFKGLTTDYKTITFQKPFARGENKPLAISVMGQNNFNVIKSNGWTGTEFYMSVSSNVLDGRFLWQAIGYWK